MKGLNTQRANTAGDRGNPGHRAYSPRNSQRNRSVSQCVNGVHKESEW
jgi:hypothetical protein